MDESLREQVAALLEEGKAESVGEESFLPIATLESGMRLGLDAEGRWVAHPAGGERLQVFESGAEKVFHEAVEMPRADFEALLERGVTELGLPETVAWSFPAVELVSAMLEMRSPHMVRLALQWPLPSELRELRPLIVEAAESGIMPNAVRDLARRLVVPE